MSPATWFASTSLATRYAIVLGVIIACIIGGAMVHLAFIRKRQRRLRELREEGKLAISGPVAVSSTTQLTVPAVPRMGDTNHGRTNPNMVHEEELDQPAVYGRGSEDSFLGGALPRSSDSEPMLELRPFNQPSIQTLSLHETQSLQNLRRLRLNNEGHFFGANALNSGFFGGVYQIPLTEQEDEPKTRPASDPVAFSNICSSPANSPPLINSPVVSSLSGASSPSLSLSTSQRPSPGLSVASEQTYNSGQTSLHVCRSGKRARSPLGLRVVNADLVPDCESRESDVVRSQTRCRQSTLSGDLLTPNPYLQTIESSIEPGSGSYDEDLVSQSYFSQRGRSNLYLGSAKDAQTPRILRRPNSPQPHRPMRSPGPPPKIWEAPPPMPALPKPITKTRTPSREDQTEKDKPSDHVYIDRQSTASLQSQPEIQHHLSGFSIRAYNTNQTRLSGSSYMSTPYEAKWSDPTEAPHKAIHNGQSAMNDWGSEVFHQIEDSISLARVRPLSRTQSLPDGSKTGEDSTTTQRESMSSIYSQPEESREEAMIPGELRPRTNAWMKGDRSAEHYAIDPVQANLASVGLNAAYAATFSGSTSHTASAYDGDVRPRADSIAQWQPQPPRLGVQAPTMIRSHSEPRSPSSPPPLIGSLEEYRWLTATPRPGIEEKEHDFISTTGLDGEPPRRNYGSSRDLLESRYHMPKGGVPTTSKGVRTLPRVALHRAVPSFPLPAPSLELKESISRLQRNAYDLMMQGRQDTGLTGHASE